LPRLAELDRNRRRAGSAPSNWKRPRPRRVGPHRWRSLATAALILALVAVLASLTVPRPADASLNCGTGEVESMTSDPANVSLDGAGNLRITPLRSASGAWTSARIETQRTDLAAPVGTRSAYTTLEAESFSSQSGIQTEATTDVVGDFAIANTGGWQSWRTVPANISAVTGVHEVFLTFASGQPADFVNVDWFTFGH
jgi:hypothetical protein